MYSKPPLTHFFCAIKKTILYFRVFVVVGFRIQMIRMFKMLFVEHGKVSCYKNESNVKQIIHDLLINNPRH